MFQNQEKRRCFHVWHKIHEIASPQNWHTPAHSFAAGYAPNNFGNTKCIHSTLDIQSTCKDLLLPFVVVKMHPSIFRSINMRDKRPSAIKCLSVAMSASHKRDLEISFGLIPLEFKFQVWSSFVPNIKRFSKNSFLNSCWEISRVFENGVREFIFSPR